MFPKSTYINRRDVLKKTISSGILLFFGNEESSMNYRDNTYHFRQDSTFLYYFDFYNIASVAAVIDIDNDREIIFADESTIDSVVWTGVLPTMKENALSVGVNEVRPLSELEKYLQEALSKDRRIHYLPPYRAEHTVKLFDLLEIHPSVQNERKSVDFIKAVVAQRNYKTQEEIEQIDKAAAISMDMHLAAIKAARPGMKEYEVAAIIQKTAMENGASLSFPIICTTHGETLHNHYHGNTLEEGRMLLLDAGAELSNGYCGDISSTVPIGRKFTQEQRTIYQIVHNSHLAAIEALKPGVPFRDVYYLSARKIVEGLKDIGLMKGDPTEAVMAGAHALFFQCGLGHMMGLDVHDMENLGEVWVGYDGEQKSTQFGIKSLRLARPLEPGFVLTIEPGIYFIPVLIDLWKAEKRFSDFINYDKVNAFRDFGGIRNEDDFLITADGKRLLGKDISKTVDAVEEMRNY